MSSTPRNQFRFTVTISPMAYPVEDRAQGYKWRSLEEGCAFLVNQYSRYIVNGVKNIVRDINNDYWNKTNTEEPIVSHETEVKWAVEGDKIVLTAYVTLIGSVVHYTDYEQKFDYITDLTDLYAINLEVHPAIGVIEYHHPTDGWITAFSAVVRHVHEYVHVQYAPSSEGFLELVKCSQCGRVAQRKVATV